MGVLGGRQEEGLKGDSNLPKRWKRRPFQGANLWVKETDPLGVGGEKVVWEPRYKEKREGGILPGLGGTNEGSGPYKGRKKRGNGKRKKKSKAVGEKS